MSHNSEGFVERFSKPWLAKVMLLTLPWLTVAEAQACAIMTLRDENTVLMGNNEDWLEPGYLWFVPGRRGRYGRVNVGFQNKFSQGSMNEKGLSFDAAVVPEMPWEADDKKDSPRNLIEKIMNECSTVEQAISYFEKYNCSHLSRSQFLFADATGDSAIIAWRPDSGLSVKRIEGRQLIATNTRLEGTGYRCQRHTRADRVLSAEESISVDTVARALESIQQWGTAFTSYSTVYDLKARKIHVFNLANFEEVVTFDLTAELAAKNRKTYELAKIFKNSPSLESVKAKPQRQDFGTRITLSQKALQRYTGVYSPTAAPEIRTRVSLGEQGLRVETPNQSPADLFPEAENLFRIAPDRGQVTFKLAPDGSVEGLILHKQADLYATRIGDL